MKNGPIYADEKLRHELEKNINELARDIWMWAEGKGFWNIPGKLLNLTIDEPEVAAYVENLRKAQKGYLMVSELGEHCEALRKNQKSKIPQGNEAEEIADLIIRALDYCGRYNLDIGGAICAKMAVNEGRPYQHGGKAF